MARSVYVISDLHLGGRGPEQPGERGFQLMSRPDALAAFIDRVAADRDSELVVNGDFLDFLAEEHSTQPQWRAFTIDPDEAAGTFEAIADRFAVVFSALGRLGRTHPLTVLLGNHDLELGLPAVARLFEARCGLSSFQWRLHPDNEALVVGRALVEHGNRYDPVNSVDYDGLRRVRSLHSRGQYNEAERIGFVPPSGSELVASVMNPIKKEYPFIDLLKPESEALFAVLLALAPESRRRLARLAWSTRGVPVRLVGGSVAGPAFRREVASLEAEGEGDEEAALTAVLAEAVPRDQLALFNEQERPGTDVSAAGARAILEGLLLGRRWGWERCIRRIQAALQWARAREKADTGGRAERRYADAASALCAGGRYFDYVVFGHTHQAIDLLLLGGQHYLNSGTWADSMRFPEAAFDLDPAKACEALAAFLADCGRGALERYIEFRPGCVHLAVAEQTIGRYRSYDAAADRLE